MASFVDQLSTLLSGEPLVELAFPNATYMERVAVATAAMRSQEIEVLVSTHLPNMCYLTGYQFTNCDYAGYLVLANDGRAAMVVPGTEVSTVLLHGWIRDVRDFPSWDPLAAAPLLRNVLHEWQLDHGVIIGVEAGLELMDTLSYRAIVDTFNTCTIVDATDLLLRQRAIKDSLEMAHQRQAARYTDAGVTAAARSIKPGVRECEIAAAAADEMIALGSEFFSTSPTVAVGTRTSIAGAMFGDRPLAPGEPVVIELAGTHQRYSVPIARTFAPDDGETRRLAEFASDVLDRFLELVRPGTSASSVVAELLSRLSLPTGVRPFESLGVGIGVDMPPSWRSDWLRIDSDSDMTFEPGMTFYSSVPMRIPGKFGAVVGDSWVCTDTGAVRLTRAAR